MDENEREVIAVEDVSLASGVNVFGWAGRLTPQATIWIGKLDNPAFGMHRDPIPKRRIPSTPADFASGLRAPRQSCGDCRPATWPIGTEQSEQRRQPVRYRSTDETQDYLYKLAESVRELYPHVRDDYLFDLEVGDA